MQEELYQWQKDTNDIWRCGPSGVLVYEADDTCYPLDNNT